MFFVINKEKVTAYAVSVFTVVLLFIMAGVVVPKDKTIETSANVQKENQINNSINENKLDE